ncbi:MAG: hypothetical protein LBD64_00320 [Odoribacteraceae bacterium]|jgi:ferric-dicitrate binding protein FerR (iron transport regulator)|nr:hypothetical protein [Odoribacteraceae bacterium]
MQHRFRFLVRQAVAGARETPGDPVEGWERVREKRAALHLRAARSRALRYAAAIVLVAATVIYLHLYRRAGAPVAGEGVDVPSRVTLILANGEQIRWEDDRQQFHVDELGISIARDSAGSVMRYSAGRVAGDATRHNRLIVPRGCEFSAQLPDGSTVWLNSATTLRFPVAFPPGERVVHLEG